VKSPIFGFNLWDVELKILGSVIENCSQQKDLEQGERICLAYLTNDQHPFAFIFFQFFQFKTFTCLCQ